MSDDDTPADEPDEASEDDQAADAGPGEGERPDHLQNVDDGCGCTEIWEHLSEE